eukprot:symbB.v1.2.001559.t1/scaffold70.1/size352959/9
MFPPLFLQAGRTCTSPDLNEEDCCQWFGLLSRSRFMAVLFLGPEEGKLHLKPWEDLSDLSDSESESEVAFILVLSCAGDEKDELQCITLDHYPGNCPENIMKGACYSSKNSANWACLPEGLASNTPCSTMQLPSQEGFYEGYCSFYQKPTTPSTTTTTTPCPVKRLRIVNRCLSEPIWIAHEAARGAIGPGLQNFLIPPDDFHDFCTPDKLTGTRYWPKMLCDDDGLNCLLGSSGGPGEGCSSHGYGQCAPPIDTKFEATFGTRGAPCSGISSKDCDFIDVSLVDGWTLPFRLSISGDCSGPNDAHPTEIDCSGLTFEKCPTDEVLGQQKYDMQAHYRGYGSVAGCYSPCLKLTDPKWNNSASKGRSRTDTVASPYCCPTPPVSPKACRDGPATSIGLEVVCDIFLFIIAAMASFLVPAVMVLLQLCSAFRSDVGVGHDAEGLAEGPSAVDCSKRSSLVEASNLRVTVQIRKLKKSNPEDDPYIHPFGCASSLDDCETAVAWVPFYKSYFPCRLVGSYGSKKLTCMADGTEHLHLMTKSCIQNDNSVNPLLHRAVQKNLDACEKHLCSVARKGAWSSNKDKALATAWLEAPWFGTGWGKEAETHCSSIKFGIQLLDLRLLRQQVASGKKNKFNKKLCGCSTEDDCSGHELFVPIETKYVEAVHRYCPGVYAYCYDDAMGLLQCSADSYYQLEFFCPSVLPSWDYVMVTTTRVTQTHTDTTTSQTKTSLTTTSVSVTSVSMTSTLTTMTATTITETTSTLNETAALLAEEMRNQAAAAAGGRSRGAKTVMT